MQCSAVECGARDQWRVAGANTRIYTNFHLTHPKLKGKSKLTTEKTAITTTTTATAIIIIITKSK